MKNILISGLVNTETTVQAKAAGYATTSVTCVADDKAHYYPGLLHSSSN